MPPDCSCFDQTKFNFCSNSMCRNDQVYSLSMSYIQGRSFNALLELSSVKMVETLCLFGIDFYIKSDTVLPQPLPGLFCK